MADIVTMRKYVRDSFANLVSMLGTTRDKAYHNEFTLNLLDRAQIEAAYRGDWVARKVVDLPAKDATRAWRDWRAEPEQIEKIEEVERAFSVQSKLKSALAKARLYGGAGLLMGFGDDPSQPLVPENVKVGSLKYLHVFAAHELSCGQRVREVQSPQFDLPEFYTVGGGGATARVHYSRVVRLIGNEIPDRSASTDGWGDSVLQSVYDAVMNVTSSTAGIASLIQETKVDVVKLPNFMQNMADPTYKSLVTERFALANQAKSMVSTLLMDKEEEWQRITTSFAGLPDIMKLYLLIACGAADIPASRFVGQAASGLNATGDNEIRNYYDNIASFQVNDLSPALAVLDEVLIRSALGDRPKEIHYEWAPLWQMDETQKAALSKTKAETSKIYVDGGMVEAEVMAKAVVGQLIEDGTYPGLESAIDEFEREGGGVDEEDPEVAAQFAEQKRKQRGEEDPEEDLEKETIDAVVRRAVRAVLDEYNENQPREDNGQFGSGGGGKSSEKDDDVRVYHGTSEDRARDILKNGLSHSIENRNFAGSYYSGEREGSVYVATSKAMAQNYAGIASARSGRDEAIVEVRVPASEWKNFSKDLRENKSFYTSKTIPPEWISKVTVVSDAGKKKKMYQRDAMVTDAAVETDHVVFVVVEFPNEGELIKDAAPRTLYVRRDLLNAEAVRAHYAAQMGDMADLLYEPEDMHVTVIYSDTPVDWIKVGEEFSVDVGGTLIVQPGGPRFHERFGPHPVKDTVVLQFASSRLCWRHENAKDHGCSSSYDEYQPHVSLFKDPDNVVDIENFEPWRGVLEFGPEIFEEVKK